MGISIGLVGLGAFGEVFAELFKKHPLVDRVGLCDREPDRIEKFAGLESWKDKFDPKDAYASLEDICKSDLDALVIITQPWLHAPQCIAAMESGKHVYSAVPIICLPDGDEILDWCDRLVNTCLKTGMRYMLGETTYYRPQTMYCRRRAAEGAFGRYVYAEGRYFHDVDDPDCNCREVRRRRTGSAAGKEWLAISKEYIDRGIKDGPMHYPTHSTSGPMCVMKAHAVKVCAWGLPNPPDDDFFSDVAFCDETALLHMSNGATMRICEYRKIGHPAFEGFNLFGTDGCFTAGPEEDRCHWVTRAGAAEVRVDQMRDQLPPEVADAWHDTATDCVAYGGHGGSHAFLVHEFVDAVANDRTPAINVWEAARYMAAGVMAHKSCLKDGEVLQVPDWGDPPT